MATTKVPPHGESTRYPLERNGRACRMMPWDPSRYRPETEGIEWDHVPGGEGRGVYEYEPQSPEPVIDMDELPEFMRPEVVEPTKTKRPAKVDKFAYRKALHGRFGPGRELTMAEYVVLGLLWDYADDGLTNAHPGAARLARDLSYSGPSAEETVRKRLRSLRRKGFIVRTRESRGPGSADTYRLTLPEWEGVGSK